MRIAAIPLALLLVTPALAGAQDRQRPPPSPAPSAQPPPPSPAPASRPDPADVAPPSTLRAERPPPPAGARPPPVAPPSRPWAPGRPYPGYGYGYGYGWPYWGGYGWGYGYYPLYPVYAEPYPSPEGGGRMAPHYGSAVLRATGGYGSNDASAAGLAFAVDGRNAGFDLNVDAFTPSRGGVLQGNLNRWQDAYGFGSAHVAFPILQGPSYRLRLQVGGSWLSVPTPGTITTSSSSVESFGFDVGASANLGLIGPLGLEGHARVTPFPVRVMDLRAALALRAGPFSVTGGYRVIDLEADSRTGPSARFEGPEFGVGVIF